MGGIVEAAVRGYCDRIDRTRLRDVVRKRVKDGSLMRLIGKWRYAGVMEEGVLPHPETGVPQGGAHPSSPRDSYLLSWIHGWQTRCGYG